MKIALFLSLIWCYSKNMNQIALCVSIYLFLFWGLFFSLILDNERWKQADVPTELQSLVDSLVDGTIKLKFPLFRFIIVLNLVIFVFW